MDRSYQPITAQDLERLRQIAYTSRQNFFARNPRYSALSECVLCVALCQGAALHRITGSTGVKDFDVWTFYAALTDIKFPPRWRDQRDFGEPKFGRSLENPEFIGRRVDLMGRSIDAETNTDTTVILRKYLSEGFTESSRRLSEKAVILLEPIEKLGLVVWPVETIENR